MPADRNSWVAVFGWRRIAAQCRDSLCAHIFAPKPARAGRARKAHACRNLTSGHPLALRAASRKCSCVIERVGLPVSVCNPHTGSHSIDPGASFRKVRAAVGRGKMFSAQAATHPTGIRRLARCETRTPSHYVLCVGGSRTRTAQCLLSEPRNVRRIYRCMTRDFAAVAQ